MMLMIVTIIPTMPTTIPNILCTFLLIFHVYHLQNTGSSQNGPILAKGEPLTVLAAPIMDCTRKPFFWEYF